MIIKFPLNERLLRRLLIESGGNIGPVTVGIATEICAAASSNDVALLESWDLGRISLNIPSATGRTPLHAAVCALCTESVDYLLSRDVDVNARDNLGHTPHDNATEMKRVFSTENSKQNEEKKRIIANMIGSLQRKVLSAMTNGFHNSICSDI